MAFAWLLWALVVLTLARPEWVGAPIERTEAARDVMLAVDISGSMAPATSSARTARAQPASTASRPSSTASSPTAATTASACRLRQRPLRARPLHPRHRGRALLLDTLAPGMAGQNTMLGDAIGLAIRSFEALESRPAS